METALGWAVLLWSLAAAGAGAAEPPAGAEGVPVLGGAPASDPQKFTFAILGDKTGGGAENWPVFDRAVDELNRLRPDFVVMVGDMIQGYKDDLQAAEAEWREFREHAARLKVPLYLVPGNHDVWDAAAHGYWKQHLGRTHYAFDHAGCHFLVLNTEEARRRGGEWGLTEEQVRWAEDDLARAAGARHTFIFLHQPIFLAKGARLQEWEAVERALSGRPATVFAGHLHNLTRHERPGGRYFVLGPTGAVLNEKPEKALGAFHHYTLVTVEGAEAHVAFVEPGAVHADGVATPEAKAALSRPSAAVSHSVVKGRLGHVRVGQVAGGTARAVGEAIKDLEAKGLSALVLDLRTCGGEDLAEAARVADLLLPAGKTLWTVQRPGARPETARTGSPQASAARVAVLIGPETTGAAEALAAALKEHGRAVLVGQATAGKPLGAATVKGPGGHAVTGRGVEPNVPLPAGLPAEVMIERAAELLRAPAAAP